MVKHGHKYYGNEVERHLGGTMEIYVDGDINRRGCRLIGVVLLNGYICTHTCTYIHIHIHTYIHIYIYT